MLPSFGTKADPIYSAGRCLQAHTQPFIRAQLTQQSTRNSSSAASPERVFQQRVDQVKASTPDPYPRLAVDERTLSCAEFRSRYEGLADNDTVEDTVVVSGRSFGPRPPVQVNCT